MKMKNEYLNDLDPIITRAQKDALQEVKERLQHRWEQIDRILTNGRPICEQTYGDRFVRMNKLRRDLITRMQTLNEAQGLIYEVMYKK